MSDHEGCFREHMEMERDRDHWQQRAYAAEMREARWERLMREKHADPSYESGVKEGVRRLATMAVDWLPGQVVAGTDGTRLTLRSPGFENGVPVWWTEEGGCISFANLLAIEATALRPTPAPQGKDRE